MDEHIVIINQLGHHTHGSDAAGVEVAKIKANTKHRALDAMELPSQIRNQAVRFTGQSEDKFQAYQQPKNWFSVHGLRKKHPCQHLQILHLIVPDQ